MASQYSGMSSGRSRFLAIIVPFHSGGRLRTTSTHASAVAGSATLGRQRPSASTPAPSSAAVPSTTRGTARGVERSDSPASLRVKALKIDPRNDGSSHGWLAMAVIAPNATSTMKNARYRHRTRAAATSASTGRA